ncbi:MAG: hypothetical protein KKF65_00240, partial [Nanoarchaeota archaeon]|nr:hypothetical protein [Nanoarchaeota archaeon]
MDFKIVGIGKNIVGAGKNVLDILANKKRERKMKRYFWLTIVLLITIIALAIFGSLVFNYLKTPKMQPGLSADIKSFSIEEDGKTAYVELKGVSTKKEIIGVKFIIKVGENEYYYETSEGMTNLSDSFKSSFINDFSPEQDSGSDFYNISIDRVEGLENFHDVDEVDVVFIYKDEEGKKKETEVLDSKKLEVQKSNNGKGSSGGGGGGKGKDKGTVINPVCVPNKICSDYANLCSVNLSDGCNFVLNCSENCADSYCVNGTCIECFNDSDCNDVIDCTEDYCLNSSCVNTPINSLCENFEFCNPLSNLSSGCEQKLCSGCSDCDHWFLDACEYDECHNICSWDKQCYYKGFLILSDNCVTLDSACEDLISECANYSNEECSSDPCNINVNGCELDNESCVDGCAPNLVNTSWSGWLFTEDCQSDNFRNRQRTLVEYDLNNCGDVLNQTFYEREDVVCDYCVSSLVNMTSNWTNVSCLSNNLMNQIRIIVQYDSNNCGEVANQSFTEYRAILACDFCTPSLVNSTSSWINVSCLFSNLMNQSRTITQYDSHFCGEVANKTFVEYRSTLGCDFCTPNLVNTTEDWINISCLGSNLINQSRTIIQYDL